MPASSLAGALGQEFATAHEKIVLRRLVLETAERHWDVQTSYVFLVPSTP